MSDNNIIHIHQFSVEEISHRTLAALRAVKAFLEDLERTDDQLYASESEDLSAATKAYRALVRDADERRDKIKPKESRELLLQICDGLAKRDQIAEAAKVARKSRKKQRARVSAVLTEFMSPAQTTLALDDDSGLGWYSDDARAVAYTALLHLDGDGRIDTIQATVMTALASKGIASIDFVMAPGEAVEDEPQLEIAEVVEVVEDAIDDLPVVEVEAE